MAKNPTQGDDQDDFSGVRNEDGSIKRAGLARTAKLSPFGLAFDEARKAGKKDFTFKGKKFTTEMAKPKAKAAAPTKPAAAPAKSAADYQKDADEFKKIAAASDASKERARNLANTMLGEDRFKSVPKLDTEPESLSGPFKKGGAVKSSASKRADGIAMKGKTKGRMV
jgi:hypothetical protein